MDECEVHRHPRLAEMRQRRGQPGRVTAAGEDQKFGVFGGLDDATGRLIGQTSATKDSASCIRLLDQLAAARPDGPVVVLDTVGYHTSHLVHRCWIGQRDRLRSLWVPASAPEPILIERG